MSLRMISQGSREVIMKKTWVLLSMLIIIRLMVSSLVELGAQEKKAPYKIGGCISLTGPVSATVKWEKDAILFAVWEINKAGGINGRPVEAIIYDNESKTDVGLMNYKKAIDVDKVVAIISSDT